jgi:hypothetical protein
MPDAKPHPVMRELDKLRTELVDLAFMLERRGRVDAADLAMSISARLGELCAGLSSNESQPDPRSAPELCPTATYKRASHSPPRHFSAVE